MTYPASPASSRHGAEQTMRRIRHRIDGAAVPGTGDRRPPVFDPATGEQRAEVVAATAQEVRAAVAVAEAAQPVLSVVRVDTYDDAVALVNDSPYGNGAAIFTRDGGAARRLQYETVCGMVGVNVPIPVPVANYSFGGWKASLFGDLHMYGPKGLRFYTRTKVVTSRWPDPATSEVDLGFPNAR